MQVDELKQLTEHLRGKSDLERDQVRMAIDFLVAEEVDPSVKVDFLEAFAKKGERAEELEEFVSCFRGLARDPHLEEIAPHAIDLCGTGGDKAGSFNVSTFVSFVVAAAGVPVIKHGNRSISSSCGSADLLEAIGIPLDPELDLIREGLDKLGFAFLFAPSFHPAFKHIAPVRKELAGRGIITVFNLLGPMINPAQPAYQVLGVYDPRHIEKMGKALRGNGLKGAVVVHGKIDDPVISGVDEITSCGENLVFGFGPISTDGVESWSPRNWGMQDQPFEHLAGGDLDENLRIMKLLLEGKAPEGLRTTVIMNAATAFLTCRKASTLEEGVDLAQSLLTQGAVGEWLEKASSFFASRR
ncbi:MAG: anthranilate phosphoribosyltransferase [Verrucomicrobiota bacterium]|nr:anthranilate phosphoribosyltransferase [Verrucomicrobiota bacterium]